MSIRLIASDMDGTLLDPYTNISQANIDAIHRLSDYGVEFLICSGRDFHDAKGMIESCGISCGYICLSGAVIYDQNGTQMANLPLNSQNLKDISHVFGEFGAPMDILTSRGRYSTADPEKKLLEFYGFLNGRAPFQGEIPDEIQAAARERMDSMTFIRDLSEIPAPTDIYKICGNDLDCDLVIRMKQAFGDYPDLAAASSFPNNIELTNTAAQKGSALKNYAAAKGISLEDVMVLGDSDNDISMFTPEFGWTVAMANSMDCIRERAKYITKSNAEDGVAWAIRKYVFGEDLSSPINRD